MYQQHVSINSFSFIVMQPNKNIKSIQQFVLTTEAIDQKEKGCLGTPEKFPNQGMICCDGMHFRKEPPGRGSINSKKSGEKKHFDLSQTNQGSAVRK